MFDQVIWNVSVAQLRVYYLIVFIFLVFLVYKYRNYGFLLWVILLFFPGLFAYAGKSVLNIYKIIITILGIYWLFRSKAIKDPNLYMIKVSFLFLSLAFFQTSLINNDYLTIILSQYSRYLLLFISFLVIYKYKNSDPFRNRIELVLKDLLMIQIILSVLKLLIIGIRESVVGSLAFDGGAFATTIPILGFIYLWISKKGKLETKDWYFTIGLLFIGFMSIKRAIWFIFPLIVALMTFYVPGRRIPIRVLVFSSIFIPLIIYAGLRLNPTLNPDNELWGSFNLEYAIDYAEKYSFGDETIDRDVSVGRGGATLQVLDKFLYEDLVANDWWGHGLRFMYASSYTEFKSFGFNIDHKGSATGIYQTYIANGIIGVIVFLWFILSLIFRVQNTRLRYVILLVFLWDYFFYSGLIGREPALGFLLAYATCVPIFSYTQKIRKTVVQKIQTS